MYLLRPTMLAVSVLMIWNTVYHIDSTQNRQYKSAVNF